MCRGRTEYGHVMAQHADAGGNRELLTGEMPWDPGAVPALMDLRKSGADSDAEAEALREPTAGFAVGGGHALDQAQRARQKTAHRPRASDRASLLAETGHGPTEHVRTVRRVESGERVSEVPIVANGKCFLVGVRGTTD